MTKHRRDHMLTPAIKEQILSEIKLGVPVRTACAHVGIGYQTFFTWLRRGRGTDTPAGELFEAYKVLRGDKARFVA